eukprot:gene4287-4115_t
MPYDRGLPNNNNTDNNQLFILVNAMKIASARRVVAQSKQKKRGTITSKLMAEMLKVAGATQILTLDLHHMQMQGFFDIPVDNIKTSPLLINYIKANIPNYQSLVVVAKNAGASKRAALIAKRLKLDFAMIYGEQTKFAESLSEEVLYAGDGSLDAASLEALSSRDGGDGIGGGLDASVLSAASYVGGDGGGAAAGAADLLNDSTFSGGGGGGGGSAAGSDSGGERVDLGATLVGEDSSSGSTLIGNVDGRPCILVDDMIDSARPYVQAGELLKRMKATKVYVLCTHGVWDATSVQEIDSSCIDEVIVTNTIPQTANAALSSKVKVIDCAHVVAECIRRIHHDESIASLYSNT